MNRSPTPQRFHRESPNGRPTDQPWELVLAGDLTDKGGELLEKLVECPFGSEGYIWFDSGGGSAYAGLALAATIRLRGLRATAIVGGECSSAALLPFAACKRRLVTAQSTLLFHPIRWQTEEDMQLNEAAEWARHFLVLEKDLDLLISRLFDYPVEKIQAWSHPGRFLSGAEFAAAGLAHLVDLFAGDLRSQLKQLSQPA